MNRRKLLRAALAATVAPFVPAVTMPKVVEVITPEDSEMLPDIDLEEWIREQIRKEVDAMWDRISVQGGEALPDDHEDAQVYFGKFGTGRSADPEIVLRASRNTIP